MERLWTLVDPADFGDWGGDDSGLRGQVWEEWTTGYETRRCEKWAECWLFDDDPIGAFGDPFEMTLEVLADFQASGIPIRQIDKDSFEVAWAKATSTGSRTDPRGDAKIRAVHGDPKPS